MEQERNTRVTFPSGTIGMTPVRAIPTDNGVYVGGSETMITMGGLAISLGINPPVGLAEIMRIGPTLQVAITDLLRLAKAYRHKMGELTEDEEASIALAEEALALSYPIKDTVPF